MTPSVGVVIGRFQIAQLHAAHKTLLTRVKNEHPNLLILLGVSPILGSFRHPLSFEVRKHMIQRDYPHAMILPLTDHPSDEVWSQQIDQLIQTVYPRHDAILYGGRESCTSQYSGRYKTEYVETHDSMSSGTTKRTEIASQIRDTEDFRAGLIYATYHQYPRLMYTVDIAPLSEEQGKKMLTLGRKRGLAYCFPGGFMDPVDMNFEAAARRELGEEMNLEANSMVYLASHKQDDWRYKNADEGTLFTALFAANIIDVTLAKASDDLDEVKTKPLHEWSHEELIKPHQWMLAYIQQQFKEGI